MAVWGAPVANEDDAERAVRAGLELVSAMPAIDPDLAARAGVLTGEAAVTVGAHGQGMVAGDLVNTASRIQSAAEPGTVLVGESTRRPSEAAIAYAAAGEHELAYGDGVAYWALAEMIRGRAKIVENEDAPSATAKLRATLELHVIDQEEREWLEPRLLHLLGLTERSAPDREDLFAAWRRFFERLAEQGPLVLVLEDIHWADEGLVAFVEYLLDWGRQHPIFVLTLARAELADRHPGFPGATRSATTLPLEPLDDAGMNELLSGLVPGLPDDVRDRLREAAEESRSTPSRPCACSETAAS